MERYRIIRGEGYDGCIPTIIYWVQVRKDKRLSYEWVDENIEPRIMSGNFSNKHLLLDEHLNDILKMNENQHYCKTNPNKL